MLLVLLVLAGLLAMHGLAPHGVGGSAHSGSSGHAARATHSARAAHEAHTTHTARAVHVAHVARVVPVARAVNPCPQAEGADPGGGHARHADAACAASGTSKAPTGPVLVPAGVQPVVVAPFAVRAERAVAAPGRAPPSLAELQLLRI
ncbi:hypothetical protein SLNWT_4207 [Streptomyces albus]|uniref:Secreted protein n=1 Tax=Streptomyces albus (strain ATCC 21838 / DSM 41398 / FERM P-419 / JCM 4703 / NBRC 107858) TaxID=1081613 RepID=A0A0B5EP98_STRA4|nr:hypothetical protein SLNWT_4207 [Streptomyces albus]AYN34627.1 hypothetical protein DUI70_4128 [Streptomyces albus]